MKYEYLIPKHKKDVKGIHAFIYGVKDGIEYQEEWEMYLKVLYFLCKNKVLTTKHMATEVCIRDPALKYPRARVMSRTELKALTKLGITKSEGGTKGLTKLEAVKPYSEYSLIQ